MARGRTLWEMLLDWFQGPRELRVYNPLHARIGSSVMLNEMDLKEENFFLEEIREYRRVIGPHEFFFCDYALRSRSLQGEERRLRLRMVPIEGAATTSGLTHHVLVLSLMDEFAYSKEFLDVVTDTTRKFEVRDNDVVTEEYWRVHDVASSYRARVTVLADLDRNKRVDRDEAQEQELEYWDYWREVPDEAGQPVKEYLFVEMNRADGWFQLWHGRETDSQKVFVF